MASFEVECKDLDALEQSMEAYGHGAQRIINDVLHGEGGRQIKTRIHMLIPSSGRSWKKKRPPAGSSDSLQQINNEMLAVTIKSKTAYNYLYFPDDGTNTKNHVGNQQFFRKGAEQTSKEIVALCLGKLTAEF